ncbi:MAG: TolB family protein [Gemmatimonas sp.]
MVNLDGSDDRAITPVEPSGYYAFPRFSAIKQRIVTRYSITGPSSTVVVLDTGITGSRRDVPLGSTLSTIMVARELADGYIRLVARRNSTGNYWVWQLANDNSLTPLALTPGIDDPDVGADISADGTRVAFLVANQLRVLYVASGVVTLTAQSDVRAPRWSSSGDKIAFLIGTGPYNGRLAIANPDGTERRQLSSEIMSVGYTWSPDGMYIIGRMFTNSSFNLVRVSDGRSALLRFPGSRGFGADYLTPDWR